MQYVTKKMYGNSLRPIIELEIFSGCLAIISNRDGEFYRGGEVMTALRREAIQMVEQMPEEQMPYVIQYIQALKDNILEGDSALRKIEMSPKMKAYWELERMIVPVSQELDYDKELAQARDEKYGYLN